MASLVASIVVLVLVPVGYAVNNVKVNVENTSAGRGTRFVAFRCFS